MEKLVRDRIPEIILADLEMPITHIANDEEFTEVLKTKLLEEIEEFIEKPSAEEAADIMEVLYAIFALNEFYLEEIRELGQNYYISADREVLKFMAHERAEDFLENQNLKKAASIIQFFYTFFTSENLDLEEVEKARQAKREERGGFEKRIILERIE
ncbi:hypothetical protein GYA49_05830 [Candidatus Beckwithbacteria bacterium]|nr:hypothetical protein [Candidatus Beckwithbacteria bacterium]